MRALVMRRFRKGLAVDGVVDASRKDAAIVELQGMLARVDWTELSPSDVATILSRHQLRPSDVVTELRQLFCDAVGRVSGNLELGDAQRQGLMRLQGALELSDQDASTAVFEAARRLYQRTTEQNH